LYYFALADLTPTNSASPERLNPNQEKRNESSSPKTSSVSSSTPVIIKSPSKTSREEDICDLESFVPPPTKKFKLPPQKIGMESFTEEDMSNGTMENNNNNVNKEHKQQQEGVVDDDKFSRILKEIKSIEFPKYLPLNSKDNHKKEILSEEVIRLILQTLHSLGMFFVFIYTKKKNLS
jgi:hypothetical protein